MKRIEWTEARIEQLKDLHKAGASYAVIGHKIGGISRSAISGKIKRLGLAEPIEEKRERQKAAAKPKRERKPRVVAFKPKAVNDLFAQAPAFHPTERTEFSCALFDLNETTCRWPIGEPGTDEFFFCGRETFGVAPYCSGHKKIGFIKPIQRVYTEDERQRSASLVRRRFHVWRPLRSPNLEAAE